MDHKRDLLILEQAPHPLRKGRFYQVEDKWYFMAREYQDQGPFNSKMEAIMGLELFLEKINESERNVAELKTFPDIIC